MNDEFMYASRPSVRAAFSEELYHHLSQQERGTRTKPNVNGRSRLNWKLVFAAFLFAVAGILTFSPKVRVFAGELIGEIAGFFVEERTESPWAELVDEDGVLDTSNATVVYLTPVPVDSILENPPFEFSMPEYIPEGFTLHESKAVQTATWVSIQYSKPNVGEILFMPESVPPEPVIGVGSAEEITINDAPALLVRGYWAKDNSHTWDSDAGFHICWSLNGVNYLLIFDRSAGFNSEELLPELIKMAESVH